MELDDLKYNWKHYNDELKEHLVLNVNALKEENLSKSETEMSKPLLHEIANIFVVGITTVIIAVFSFIHLEALPFSLPGFIAVGIGLIYIYFAAVKTRKIHSIDYYNSSIIDLQKEISSINLLILKYRKLELALFPIFILLILPITFKVIQNRDLYADINFYLLEASFIIGFGFIGIYYINKYLYDQKINKVHSFLEEIEHFKK